MTALLRSDRIELRPFREDDARDVQRLAGAFEIADTTLAIPHPYEDGMAERWIDYQADARAAARELTLAIIAPVQGHLLGAISLLHIEPDHQAEIGYWIGVPYWGRGYCTEAGRLIIVHAFERMRLQRLHARHLSRNPASGRVLRKLGFSHEGTRRAHVMKWGKPEDVELYGLLRTEADSAHSPEG